VNFYKHFIGDYARDTAHLSMLEHAAYRLLLDHYYATERKLPMPAQCERICRASTEEEKLAVRTVLAQFFKNGVNERAEEELKKIKDYGDAQAMRAHMRWQSKGNASHSHSHSNSNSKDSVGKHPQAPDSSPVLQTLPLREGGEFEVRESLVAELEPLYPKVDVPATVREMKGWLVGNPDRRKTRKGVKRFITTWLQNEQQKAEAR
jgi:uncharacterized protein YdaU (DUF1376 family)